MREIIEKLDKAVVLIREDLELDKDEIPSRKRMALVKAHGEIQKVITQLLRYC
jgi:dsDNA-specific endonuclease/ATPase MutS2